MGNKIKYNLKNVHAAVLTETTTSNGVTYSYDTPEPIPGAVSLSLDAEGESSPFYADGVVYFRSATNNGYSGEQGRRYQRRRGYGGAAGAAGAVCGEAAAPDHP